MELGNYAHARKISVQFNSILERRGRGILQSGTADITISQFEELFTTDVSERLKDILALLRTAHNSGEPLSLTEARALYCGCLQDTLCSILGRVGGAFAASQTLLRRSSAAACSRKAPWTACSRRSRRHVSFHRDAAHQSLKKESAWLMHSSNRRLSSL